MSGFELALELAEQGYGVVHIAGCRDLRDPEPIGSARRLGDVDGLVEDSTGWDVSSGVPTAPYVSRVLPHQPEVTS